MRIPLIRCCFIAAVVAVVSAIHAPSVWGQGGFGGGGGGMPNPGALFKKEKEKEIVGLSLAATDEPVLEVRVEGNRLIPTQQILNEMQTRVGRPYDPALIQRDIRKLTGRSWFVAVEPQIEKTEGGRIVTIRVAERPTIRYIEYLGNDVGFLGRGGIRDKALAKETGLKVGNSIDPYAVEDARRKILALYRRNGFNDTQVTVLEGNKTSDQGVVFLINQGEAQKIWKVDFEGNEFVSDGRLRTQVEEADDVRVQRLRRSRTDRQRRGKTNGLLPGVRLLPGQGQPQTRIQRTGRLGHVAVHHQRGPALRGPERASHRQPNLPEHFAGRRDDAPGWPNV
jgi:outer membrane protein insertion porin family